VVCPCNGVSLVMESYYSLNIALNGSHYARVTLAKGSRVYEQEAKDKAKFIADAMRKAMPARWDFTLTYWEGRGHGVTLD
jgi:hypothetical protein